MENEGIVISLDEVTATANSIAARNEKLSQMLLDISKKVLDLDTTWQSEGGQAIREAMTRMSPVFENYKSYINDYVKFLNEAVAAYEETETQIKNNASSFN